MRWHAICKRKYESADSSSSPELNRRFWKAAHKGWVRLIKRYRTQLSDRYTGIERLTAGFYRGRAESSDRRVDEYQFIDAITVGR